jgi:hypothetical protein
VFQVITETIGQIPSIFIPIVTSHDYSHHCSRPYSHQSSSVIIIAISISTIIINTIIITVINSHHYSSVVIILLSLLISSTFIITILNKFITSSTTVINSHRYHHRQSSVQSLFSSKILLCKAKTATYYSHILNSFGLTFIVYRKIFSFLMWQSFAF